MKKYMLIGFLAIFLSACGNMPGQQLCVCTDDDYTSTQQRIPPANVPPPPVAPDNNCPYPTSSGNAFSESTKPQTTQKEVESNCQQPVAIGHVYPLSSTVVVCDVPPVRNSYQCSQPSQCQIHSGNTTVIDPQNASPSGQCRFDSMPISPNMSISEKLNRTR